MLGGGLRGTPAGVLGRNFLELQAMLRASRFAKVKGKITRENKMGTQFKRVSGEKEKPATNSRTQVFV